MIFLSDVKETIKQDGIEFLKQFKTRKIKKNNYKHFGKSFKEFIFLSSKKNYFDITGYYNLETDTIDVIICEYKNDWLIKQETYRLYEKRS